MFEHASQLDPKNSALLSALAECQVKNNNSAAATLTYEQAIAMNPSAASSEYKALGDLYLAQKKTDLAISSYKKYVDKNPKEVTLAKFIGEQEYKAKHYAEAKKYLGMVTGEEAKTAAFLQIYGKSLLRRQRPSDGACNVQAARRPDAAGCRSFQDHL